MIITTKPIAVTFLDGKSETINLPRLTLRQLYVWAKAAAQRDTPALVCLCTGKPPEWLDTLTDESYATLAQACISENFQRAMTVAKSEPVIAAQIVPLVAEMQASMLTAASLAKPSSDLSPTPAPAESAAETGTASST